MNKELLGKMITIIKKILKTYHYLEPTKKIEVSVPVKIIYKIYIYKTSDIIIGDLFTDDIVISNDISCENVNQ